MEMTILPLPSITSSYFFLSRVSHMKATAGRCPPLTLAIRAAGRRREPPPAAGSARRGPRAGERPPPHQQPWGAAPAPLGAAPSSCTAWARGSPHLVAGRAGRPRQQPRACPILLLLHAQRTGGRASALVCKCVVCASACCLHTLFPGSANRSLPAAIECTSFFSV